MATITPTVSSFSWGPEAWQVASYFAHPTRDTDSAGVENGNPVLLWRHAGGGTTGDHLDCWASSAAYNSFFEHLNSEDRTTHFDIISIETAQRGFYGTANVPRSCKKFGIEAVRDVQRCISSMRTWARKLSDNTGYVINPDLVVAGGHSFGGTVVPLAVLMGGVSLRAEQKTPVISTYCAAGYNPTVLGCINFAGQIDCRKIDGVYYIDPSNLSGWFGTNGTDDTELDAVPSFLLDAMSQRAYIENGDTQTYKPFYVCYEDYAAAGTLPLSDAHDPRQYDDMIAALAGAGLVYSGEKWTNSSHAMPTDVANRMYQWMAGLVRQARMPASPTVK